MKSGSIFTAARTQVSVQCDACGKAFRSRHRCKVNGARWRINKHGISIAGRTAVRVIPIVRVALP